MGKTTTLLNETENEFPDAFSLELREGVNYRFRVAAYDSDLPDLMTTIAYPNVQNLQANEKFLYSKDLVGEANFTFAQVQRA